MGTGFVQQADVMDFVAPSGGVAVDKVYLINGLVVIALETAAEGVTFSGRVGKAALNISKTSAQAWNPGDVVYLDATNHVADSGAGGIRVGVCLATAANPTATGLIFFDANAQGSVKPQAIVSGLAAPTSKLAAGNITLTIAELLTGIITIDCGGGARTVTLPTAALAVAGIANAKVGDQVRCKIVNGADAAETITLAEGVGGTWDANFVAAKTIAQNGFREVVLRLTNVTAAAEAYVVYMV
jgi:predicted RecA/RadA family phage recombinase